MIKYIEIFSFLFLFVKFDYLLYMSQSQFSCTYVTWNLWQGLPWPQGKFTVDQMVGTEVKKPFEESQYEIVFIYIYNKKSWKTELQEQSKEVQW